MEFWKALISKYFNDPDKIKIIAIIILIAGRNTLGRICKSEFIFI